VPVTRPAQLGSGLACTAELDPAIKKPEIVETELGPGLRPNWPNLFWVKGMFGKTHPSVNSLYFILFCFDIWPNEPFCDIKKFQKN